MSLKTQIDSAVALLQSLIETQSFSSEEDGTALLIINWLEEKGITLSRKRNNIYASVSYTHLTLPTKRIV